MKRLMLGGIEIAVEKKKIKHLYVRVYPPDGCVRISAPRFASDEAIRAFAASRLPWIEKQRQRIAGKPKRREYAYMAGETHFLWGRPYRLEVVCGRARDEVQVEGETIILKMRGENAPARRAKIMDEWRRALLKGAVPPALARSEEIAGVRANEWRVKNMRTRWGTCNIPQRRIWLNLRLVEKPPECLEYVILHELVHLLERGHNKAFKAYMDQFLPGWRAVKARLNEGEG